MIGPLSFRLLASFFLAFAWERKFTFVVGFIVGGGVHAAVFGGW